MLKVFIFDSATFVESFLVFWVNEVSEDVEIVSAEPPITPSTATTTTSTTPVPPIEGINVYEGCGVSKTCFGIGPGDCVRNSQCNTFGAVIYRDEKFIFEMRSSSKKV